MKWEYRVLHDKTADGFVGQANAIGAEGFEMVHAETLGGFVHGFFKRAIVEIQEPEPEPPALPAPEAEHPAD